MKGYVNNIMKQGKRKMGENTLVVLLRNNEKFTVHGDEQYLKQVRKKLNEGIESMTNSWVHLKEADLDASEICGVYPSYMFNSEDFKEEPSWVEVIALGLSIIIVISLSLL